MIKTHHSRFWSWVITSYGQLMQMSHFRKVTVKSDDVFLPDSSVVLLQNHFSKWDGYWSMYLSKTFFKRRFHVMMLEDQLARRMFLARCGVFSVRKNSRDMIESLNYTAELLNNPKNLVAIYPSGKLLSQHQQNFKFQRGFVRVTNAKEYQPILAMAVVLVDYFGYARPEVRIYLKNYMGERTPEAIETAYHLFYQSCISKQTE